MTEQHPITPSPELIEQWLQNWDWRDDGPAFNEAVVIKAASWGWQQRDASVADELQKARDEELEACCEWLDFYAAAAEARDLRAARRPKPPSLAEEATLELEEIMDELHTETGSAFTATAIRRALERLQELEGQGND